jgi:cytochrome c-type biogenesis protein CcmH/NrfG
VEREPQPAPEGPSPLAFWLVSGLAGISFGLLAGYVLATQVARPSATAVVQAASAPASGSAPALVDEQELDAQKRMLANDPGNAAVAVRLGNMLYDAQRFADALPYYQKALALDPKNVNVSTDLGTSLWNLNRSDEAIAQFEKSLAIDPTHPNTLFNLGIVRLHGKNDSAGASAAWRKLLETNPTYPNAAKVRQMLAQVEEPGT